MPRRIVACLAALVAAATLAPGAGPADAAEARTATTAARATTGSTDPLEVTVGSLTPGVVPRRGPIRISGEVTNLSEETWTTVNLYSFISSTPMTTAAELAEAQALPLDSSVGERVSDVDARDTIEEITPGDTQRFAFEVPRSLLPVTEAGVYWFGVQAVGQGPDGRDDVADGRARTFLPLVPRRTTPLPTSLVLQLRRRLSYAPDGSVAGLQDWIDTLSTGGRLRSVVDLGLSAGSRAITYVIDPAVVAAAEQLAAGNPARSIKATVEPGDAAEDDGSGQESSSASPSVAPDTASSSAASGDGDGAQGDDPAASQDPLTAQAQAAATDWLVRLNRALPGHQVLALPYGDLDVAAAADHDPGTYLAARQRSGTELASTGQAVAPVVASPGGYLDPAALAMIDPSDTVLLTDAMFTTPAGEVAADDSEVVTGVSDTSSAGPAVPTVATDDGHRIVVTSTASTVGPGPGEARSPLSVRQETLAQGAVRALDGDPQPLVVMLPNDWNPSSPSGFFSGFDVDWLDMESVGEVADSPATPIDLADLTYPRSQVRNELGSDSFTAAADLTTSGGQLEALLTRNDTVGAAVGDQALTTLSYSVRSTPVVARTEAAAATRWVRDQLGKVHIEAPPAITMTGTTGRFYATITNDLAQPVTVALDARVTQGIEISRPRKIRVPAAVDGPGRTRVLLTASAPTSGVHTVMIGLTDIEGVPIGGSDTLTVRSLHISMWFWVVLAGLGGLLFAAIAVRLVRRVRASRRTPPGGGAPAEPERVDA